MTADELKAFCKERNLTYKELAEKIGYGEGAVKNAVSSGKISDTMAHAIKMLIEIETLKSELEKANNFRLALSDFLAHK